jgi:hypothetical protein
MHVEQIVTDSDFITLLLQLSRRAAQYHGSLEEYLRSTLRVATAHKEEPATWRLLAQVLAEALTTPPPPFDDAWLADTDPPESVWQPQTDRADPFAALQHMLRYQIADLHRMAEIGTINDPYRYGGIDSPTGKRWHNFDPETYLECAGAGMGDGHGTTECSWANLTFILKLGHNYE